MYKRNIEVCSYNHCCFKKSNKYYTFWVCVCSLRYPACNSHAPYFYLWPVRLYDIFFPLYLINGTIFEEKLLKTEYVFLFSLQRLSETFFIVRRTKWDVVINVYLSSCKVPLLLSEFSEICIFSTEFRKTQIPNLIKIRLVGGEFYAGREMDRRSDGKTDKQTDRRDEANGKGKTVSLQAWSGLEDSRKLRFPDYMKTAQDSGKIVSLTHRPRLPPGNAPGTHFCWRLSRPQDHSAIGMILCQWKIPMTPAGIEPATFRFVTQHLNHCANAVPS